ncbi:MAG TPA: hypothetical protein IAB56_01115 [Candidatus Scybalousia intestinigallinarum]|nr:hypothetical protein [Candidatus Scybalousia intestinigallinarum]
MFKKDSLLYEVNIISKLISSLLVIISLLFLNSTALIVLVSVILCFLSLEFKFISKVGIIGVLLSILATFYPQFLGITKFIIFIEYIMLIKKVTDSSELRYILEVTLYKFQSKKITYHILYIIYFFRYLKKNMKLLDNLREDYAIEKDFFYIRFSLKKALAKTKHEIHDLMEINELRFYNYTSKRTYIERPTWEKWDTNYLLFHIAVLIFAIIYGG